MTDGKTVHEGRFCEVFKWDKKLGKAKVTGYLFYTFCKHCLDGRDFKATHWVLFPEPPEKSGEDDSKE